MNAENHYEKQYEKSIQQTNQLVELLQKIKKLQSLEELEEVTTAQDYLELLGNLIYSLNSAMYCYCHLKGQTLPQQFNKVKQYYMKAKNTLSGKIQQKQKSKNPVVINKVAAKRLIEAGLKQASEQ